jgi:hypothetical protein
MRGWLMRANKKAEQLKFLYLVIWAIMLSVFLVIVAFFTSAFVRQQIDIRDAEARIFMNRLLYSQTGISRTDEDLGRSYPGTIDLKKIETGLLSSYAYIKDNQMMAAKIEVVSKSANINKITIYNEGWYSRWLPLAGQKGSGASTWINESRYVTIYDGDEFKGPGAIRISVLMPNG